MSLVTAGIDCMLSQHLLGAMEDCSIVRGPQLQRLCCQNCCMSGQRRMFGSLWSVVITSIDDKMAVVYLVKCQTVTDGRMWPPWSRRAGVLVASVADGALALCGRNE